MRRLSHSQILPALVPDKISRTSRSPDPSNVAYRPSYGLFVRADPPQNSVSGGHADAVRWVSTFQRGGWTSKVDMILTPTTPFSQRAQPAPLWCAAFPKLRMGRGLTRIPRPSAARLQLARPRFGRTVRRAAPEGVLVEGATPLFSPLVRRGRGQRWTGLWPPFAPPFCGEVAPSTVIPAGRLKTP